MIRKIVFVMIAVFVMMPCTGICETIDWKHYNDGMRQAKQQNKKVLLHFRTDWCGYCAQMDQTTFKDTKVVLFLNEFFVSIKVDGDRQKAIAKTYGVKGYPDNRLLDEKRNEAYRLPGFVEPGAFLFFLEYVQTNSYKTMDPMQYYKSR